MFFRRSSGFFQILVVMKEDISELIKYTRLKVSYLTLLRMRFSLINHFLLSSLECCDEVSRECKACWLSFQLIMKTYKTFCSLKKAGKTGPRLVHASNLVPEIEYRLLCSITSSFCFFLKKNKSHHVCHFT
jgi:hypothetical protein